MKTLSKIDLKTVFRYAILIDKKQLVNLLNQLELPEYDKGKLVTTYSDMQVMELYVDIEANQEVINQLIKDLELFEKVHQQLFTVNRPHRISNFISLISIMVEFNKLTGEFIRYDKHLQKPFFV